MLKSELPRDAALVLGASATNESGVEDKTVLGSLAAGLEGSAIKDTELKKGLIETEIQNTKKNALG
jgi:hypothetical protein